MTPGDPSLRDPSSGDQPSAKTALYVLIVLVLIDVILAILYMYTLEHSSDSVTKVFHFDIEKNVPSTYSAIQLVAAGIAALACMKVESRSRAGSWLSFRDFWMVIGVILILMGVDEFFSYHEGLGQLLYRIGLIDPDSDTIGGYAWPWTVYGMILAVAVGVPAIHYTWKIFRGHRYLFYLLLLAGAIFVAGAIGIEDFGVYLDSYRGSEGADAAMLVEELFEMLAVSLAIFVFLRYRGERRSELAQQ